METIKQTDLTTATVKWPKQYDTTNPVTFAPPEPMKPNRHERRKRLAELRRKK